MDNWKVTIPCTLAEAQAVTGDMTLDDTSFGSPSLVASEVDAYADPQAPGSWALHAYFTQAPETAWIDTLRDLIPSAADAALGAELLPDEDWVTLSQAGLEPIRAGRFHVHTPEMPASDEPGVRSFEIPASLAFGTGHHNTTRGCLMMLDSMQAAGIHVTNHIDIGTGTGLLAFAAMHLWPGARAIASDIDPVCGPAVEHNAAASGVAMGDQPGVIQPLGNHHRQLARLQARAPYDLVIANILAGPLIELSADVAAVTAPNGHAVLSGLLGTQAEAVADAYRAQGFALEERLDLGDWTVLRLCKTGGA